MHNLASASAPRSSLQRARVAFSARSVWLTVIAAALFGAGCADQACFEWTENEGACPSQAEALVFFQDPVCPEFSDIQSVDSAGDYDEGACCYSVTKRDADNFDVLCGFDEGAVGTGATTGVGGSSSGGGFGGGVPMPSGAGGAGGVGGSPACTRCAEALAGGDTATLCPSSLELYNALFDCSCTGACMMACANDCNSGMSASMTCQTCMQDANNGCGNELNNCANDL